MNNKLLFLISLSLLFVLGSVGFASAKTNPNFSSDNKTEIRKFFMREYLTHNNAFDVLVEMPDTLKDLEFIDEEDSDKVPFFESYGARNYKVERGTRIENSDKEGYGIYKFHCDFFGGKRLCTVKQDQEALAATRRLLRKIIKNSDSDYKKIKNIYDWIWENVDRKRDIPSPIEMSCWSAIIKKRTICGAAALFDQACELMGIESRVGMMSVNDAYDRLKGEAYNYVKLPNGKWYITVPRIPDGMWSKRRDYYNFYAGGFLLGMKDIDASIYAFEPIYGFEEFQNAVPMAQEDYIKSFVEIQLCISKSSISKQQKKEFYNKIPEHLFWLEEGAVRKLSEYRKPKRKGFKFIGWKYYFNNKRTNVIVGEEDGRNIVDAIWKKKKRKKKSKYRIKVTVNSKKANYKNKKLKPPILGALILINTLEQVL